MNLSPITRFARRWYFSQSRVNFGSTGNKINSLSLIDSKIRKSLFNKIDPDEGPESILDLKERREYHSPLEIDETFKLALNIIKERSDDIYAQIKKLKQEECLNSEKIENLLFEAEKYNPEVLYNFENYSEDILDKSHPVYRSLMKQKWVGYDQMLLMQRLEQLHVIPDTLPTLDPKVDVKIKFSHNTDEEFHKWIVPGLLLPAFAVAYPPTIKIQEFDYLKTPPLYTVIMINPDVPDLSRNSFSTSLHFGLQNVSLDYNNNTIGPSTYLNLPESSFFKPYLPLLPEKNAPTQRACIWVFRQSSVLKIDLIPTEMFDVRAFVSLHNLLPVGAHFWRQQFDRSVNEFASKHNQTERRVFSKIKNSLPLKE